MSAELLNYLVGFISGGAVGYGLAGLFFAKKLAQKRKTENSNKPNRKDPNYKIEIDEYSIYPTVLSTLDSMAELQDAIEEGVAVYNNPKIYTLSTLKNQLSEFEKCLNTDFYTRISEIKLNDKLLELKWITSDMDVIDIMLLTAALLHESRNSELVGDEKEHLILHHYASSLLQAVTSRIYHLKFHVGDDVSCEKYMDYIDEVCRTVVGSDV